MERIVLASSNEGDLVADFFWGSGSFIKKAFELGRRCIGCDISPKALDLAHCPTMLAHLTGGFSPLTGLFCARRFYCRRAGFYPRPPQVTQAVETVE